MAVKPHNVLATLIFLSNFLTMFCVIYFYPRGQEFSRSYLEGVRGIVSNSENRASPTEELLGLAEVEYQSRLVARSNMTSFLLCPPGINKGTCDKAFYYMHHLSPTYSCFAEIHVAEWGEGGKWLCNISGLIPQGTGIVYSVGSNGLIGFEEAMYQKFSIKSYTMDPSLNAEKLQLVNSKEYIRFYEFGLTGDENLEESLKSLGSSLQRLGLSLSANAKMMRPVGLAAHLNHSFVHVFKLDCEGCEESLLADLKRTTTREKPLFGQILIEMHRINDIGATTPMFEALESLGYRLFHVEPNYLSMEQPATFWELCYIHESLVQPTVKA